MSRINQTQRGFTLIELMISISILSLLLFTGSYAYSMLSERWNKELGQFSKVFQEAKNLELLQRSLEGTHPFVLIDNDKHASLLFIGGSDSVLAASRYTLHQEHGMEIFRLSSIMKDNGLIDLVYQSVSANDIFLTHPTQEIIFSNKFVLLSNLQSIDFSYYGFSHLDKIAVISKICIHYSISSSSSSASPQWYSSYSGLDSKLMPEKVKVSIRRADSSIITFYVYLQQRSERWYRHYLEEIE